VVAQRSLGSFQAGSNDCKLDVPSSSATLLAIDLAPMMIGIPGLPMIDGTLLINPGARVTALSMPGPNQLPLDLSNVPSGVSVAAQAAALGNGLFHLSEPVLFQTWQ
jgi:hypothetical protein